jgi:hypothetical protein
MKRQLTLYYVASGIDPGVGRVGARGQRAAGPRRSGPTGARAAPRTGSAPVRHPRLPHQHVHQPCQLLL